MGETPYNHLKFCIVMQASKYIFVVPLNTEQTILFCGVTNLFLLLSKQYFESITLILQNPNAYENTHPKIINLLKNNGFIVDDGIQEINILKEDRSRFVNSLVYKSTIVSTFNCNYNCWYCIQKHVKEQIDYDKINLIIKHVKTYLIENGIRSYILSWFGGEPLMEPEVIDYVSSSLYEFCFDNKIEFNGAITTNGSLLKSDIIKMLKKNHIDCYQITIDGDKESHNKVKRQKGEESSFDTILSNIVDLLKFNKQAEMNLRFNYTSKSIKSKTLVDEVNAIVPQELRSRISVDFQKVWQEKEMDISIRDLSLMLLRFHKSGYIINSDHVFSICYVDKLHHNTLFYNGGVEKCDNRGINDLRGKIDSSGHIVWKEKPVINDVDPLDDNNCCNKCKYYPVCFGCCPVHREERILKEGKMICNYKGHFEVFEHRILDYCVRQLIKNNVDFSL